MLLFGNIDICYHKNKLYWRDDAPRVRCSMSTNLLLTHHVYCKDHSKDHYSLSSMDIDYDLIFASKELALKYAEEKYSTGFVMIFKNVYH